MAKSGPVPPRSSLRKVPAWELEARPRSAQSATPAKAGLETTHMEDPLLSLAGLPREMGLSLQHVRNYQLAGTDGRPVSFPYHKWPLRNCDMELGRVK